MRFKIFIFVLFIFYVFIIWEDLAIAETADPYKMEWITFCETWMRYVNQYPDYLSAGCCEFNHPSNDLLKEGWKGESLLRCNA
tara:strand:+ start:257 stop:505 length:249 start_codon:yes stop_codon:yes gene_type:complete